MSVDSSLPEHESMGTGTGVFNVNPYKGMAENFVNSRKPCEGDFNFDESCCSPLSVDDTGRRPGGAKASAINDVNVVMTGETTHGNVKGTCDPATTMSGMGSGLGPALNGETTHGYDGPVGEPGYTTAECNGCERGRGCKGRSEIHALVMGTKCMVPESTVMTMVFSKSCDTVPVDPDVLTTLVVVE